MKIVRIIFVSLLFTLIFLVTGCNPGEKKSNSDEEQKKYAIPYNLTVEDIWVEQETQDRRLDVGGEGLDTGTKFLVYNQD